MQDLNKQQLVLLVLLVSFITALVTGIVAVTLMGQAPQPLTQTIQKVVEKVVEKSTEIIPEPLKKSEKEELELAALARDVLIEDIVRRVSPAVVSVIASKDIPIIEELFISPFDEGDPFSQLFPELRIPQFRQRGSETKQVSSGTGFFVSKEGFLLTNKHVVEDKAAEYSVIMNDGRKTAAKIIARDPLHDMAVLKADAPKGIEFPFVLLGDSDSVKVGHSAIAIGNALGEFSNTVSVGVISGLRRNVVAFGSVVGLEELSEVIQTDAAINPGNSGGPLLNLKGEAIGLNSAVARGAENIGFSIPVNQIKKSLSAAKSQGKIAYPFLGVHYTLITQEFKKEKKLSVDEGALIVKNPRGGSGVIAGSPADKAGLKEGDIILEISGLKINKDHSLAKIIQQYNIGDKVNVKFLRASKETSVELTLEERKGL